MRANASPLTLSLWRDYRDEVLRLPGIHLGTAAVTTDAAAAAREFYASGARRVELITVADVSSDADPRTVVRILDLLRELTAWGMVVDWRVRLTDVPAAGMHLGHLYPPREIDGPKGAADLRAEWARGFFLGKCHYRKGPGFLEIRDHRLGVLNRIIIDEAEYLAAVDTLRRDPTARGVPAGVLDDLAAESLTLQFGDCHWWTPCPVYRWPQQPFLV